MIVKILTFALGLYLIFVSIIKILETLKLKQIGYDGWFILMITSGLLFVFGIFVAINPMASMDMIQVAAVFIILSSILEISNLFMVFNKALEIEKLFKKIK